ncbi:murein hydrolase activator EnvC [Rhodobacter sp. 24-YEA-8]|uniref:murein hydrolase activator EnvC family protein n=1 Tax=Rhodobacter sp. 24-YEA-8 TaxID=1884310 RepID=UPI0008962BC9|nr:peptidoglycan DD-metalloendopeptidase family protein [Rhodobacter sp. 24-YEA-8]SEB49248.1 Septal ring factor EnvC, activator of murein hydrolases AmiA and AmiB [Rhodobacter sp. 24-YEA-8]
MISAHGSFLCGGLALALMLAPAMTCAQEAEPDEISAALPVAEPAVTTDAGLTVSDQAARASGQLRDAVAAMEAATTGRAQVAALTQTVRAYEEGLAALREALRQAELREEVLKLRFNAKRDRVGQLVSALAQMEQNRGPLLLIHPAGPLGTARSGMLVAEVTPLIQAEADQLRRELQELADLRALQVSAGQHLTDGLASAQAARTALSKAISARTDLPKRFTDDPVILRALLESADTLDSFAAGLIETSTDGAAPRPFVTAMGVLPLPVVGSLIRRPDEADGAGVRRPGMTLATRDRALVTAPWPGTIRYLGPLLDYGNVIILELGDGYLLVLGGLGTVYGEVGEVVATGAPLGLMGGSDGSGSVPVPTEQAPLAPGGSKSGAGAEATETLYLELRMGATAVDPTEWFAATASTGD